MFIGFKNITTVQLNNNQQNNNQNQNNNQVPMAAFFSLNRSTNKKNCQTPKT